MGLYQCMKCVKYTLFIFNFFFWLVGGAILGFGLYLLINPLVNSETRFAGERELYAIRITLIVLGAIIMLLGFLGCCGAILENKCMLIVFFILMTLIFLGLVTLGLLFVFMKVQAFEMLVSNFEEERMKAIKLYEADTSNTENEAALDSFHEQLKCCGAGKGKDDFTIQAPASCKDYKPCGKVMMANLNDHWLVGVVCLFTAAVITLIGMVFSLMLCCALRDDYD